ncbi:MAG: PKD domain-containing protein [Candidatus Anstonellaceae archaeon]
MVSYKRFLIAILAIYLVHSLAFALESRQVVVADELPSPVGNSNQVYHQEVPAPEPENLPPVIVSISGPSSLQVGQVGTWTISAYDPEGGPLTYSVRWGDEEQQPIYTQSRAIQVASFNHAYHVPGTYYPTFRVYDAQGASASASASVVVFIVPSYYILPNSLPNGIVGMQYRAVLWTNLDTANWTVSGSLPPGLTLFPDASTATIQGIPTSIGTYQFTISAYKENISASRTYAVSISQMQSAFSCAILPSSLEVPINSSTRLQAKCYARAQNASVSEISCPDMFWTSSIGVVERDFASNGTYANFLSGSTPGFGQIIASDTSPLFMKIASSRFTCSIPVRVLPANENVGGATGGTGGAGGSSGGGGGSGGATTATIKVSVACAGQPSTIDVRYYSQNAQASQLDIYRVNGRYENVFSQSVSGTSTVSFTAPTEGQYELRLSIGKEQKTTTFQVSACAPQRANITQNFTISLTPTRELVFSKSLDYPKGFSKEFKVYRISSGSEESFSTEITLHYQNTENYTLQNATIIDSIPKSVVSSAQQIIFDTYPIEVLSEGQDLKFSWAIRSLPAGEKVRFSYRFNRAINEAMFEKFGAPATLQGQTLRGTIESQRQPQADLLAANIAFAGFTLPLSLLAAALLGLILVGLILLFLFGGKKEQ